MGRAATFWGAHACGVLVGVFCGDELCLTRCTTRTCGTVRKFAIAECDRQHARGVRSPDCLRRSGL